MKTSNSRLWCANCKNCKQCSHFRHANQLVAALGSDIRVLPSEHAQLSRLLTKFEMQVSTIMGVNCLLTDRSGSCTFKHRGDHFMVRRGGSNLRCKQASASGGYIYLSLGSVQKKMLPAVYVTESDGTVSHRVDLIEPNDMLTLAQFSKKHCFMDESVPYVLEPANPPTKNRIELVPYLESIQHWHQRPLQDHVDDLFNDKTAFRQMILHQLPSDTAWQIDPAVLPRLLEHLTTYNVNFVRMVPQPSIHQSVSGPLDEFQYDNGLTYLIHNSGTMVLDVYAVAEAWVTIYGRDIDHEVYGIELFDQDGNVMCWFLSSLHGTGQPDISWMRILRALPRYKK